MNYKDYHFTFAILNRTESRRFSIIKHPGFLSLRLKFLYLAWEIK